MKHHTMSESRIPLTNQPDTLSTDHSAVFVDPRFVSVILAQAIPGSPDKARFARRPLPTRDKATLERIYRILREKYTAEMNDSD
ncbi:hypothetical protein [Mycolicibacterium porcinum]|uniref:hypothetical protein n=1 Tax=Mycolicibacterium porcinum TaxID=39693 RepID=UPI000B279D06|nr:hypothetical protein [Mycolicibacterium porcinum]